MTRTRARRTQALDPATRFVRSLDGEYLMVREAAEVLGVSDRTLRNLYQGKVGDDPDRLGPSFKVNFGKMTIYLYTKDDIAKIRKYLQDRKTVLPNDERVTRLGRPAKWTIEQRKHRQRLWSSKHYHSRRARDLDSTGKKTEAKAHRDIVKGIDKELKDSERAV